MIRQCHSEDFFAVALQLPPEASTDIGRNHAKLVLRDSSDQGEQHSEHVWHLGRRPEGEFATRAHRGGDDSARFHRRWYEPLLNEATRDDHIRASLRGCIITARKFEGVAGVGAFVGVN